MQVAWFFMVFPEVIGDGGPIDLHVTTPLISNPMFILFCAQKIIPVTNPLRCET